ncbi:MAG: ATP-binding cassette domain-containing protein [Acidobacteriota bacterium]
MSATPSVSVNGLVRRFGDFVAVDHIDFQVWRGEIFGFLGSNGAGKTTTIRMLCGLLRPSAGEASVGGFDVYTQAERIKQTIGYMSQRFSLYDELTVAENLSFFSGVYRVRGSTGRRRRKEVLDLMGLQERRATLTGLLPGGWKQRLALACAIAHEPSILFLDEPTSGVDPIARRSFWDLIYQLSEQGRTVFVTTHYMDEAEYCHRLALMHDGRIIAMDTPSALRRSLTKHHLMRLDSTEPLETLRLLEDREEIVDAAVFGAGLHLQVKDPVVARQVIEDVLQAERIGIKRLEIIEPSMEDVFVSLIAEERATK